LSDQAKLHDVVILGSGPAGLTAAIYAARAGLAPVVVEGLAAGGQLMTTTDVENYPGFPDGVMGPEMMELFRKQAAKFGATFVPGDATRVDLSERPFQVWVGEERLASRSLIVATGASPRYLDIPGEKQYAGKGVSYCATCDGFFFRGKPIVVVGGGDSAVEEALFLTRFGSTVTLIHRRDRLRASKIMADRALASGKIEFLWNSAAVEVVGDGGKVTAVRVRSLRDRKIGRKLKAGESDKSMPSFFDLEIPCAGFFVAIGHVPNTKLFEGMLPMNDQGYLLSRTSVPGVFVSGDVHDHVYRQAITAAGEGCKAAIDCERWLAHK
jgi:thioredoxin reductase (NADPH)